MKEKQKDLKHKKKKKEKKSKRHKEKKVKNVSSSSSGSESDEWVEQEKSTSKIKEITASTSRDDWMSMKGISTFTKEDIKAQKVEKEKKHIDSYNPSTSSRELNPYWKDGGTGLPQAKQEEQRKSYPTLDNKDTTCRTNSSKFKRPGDDDDYYSSKKSKNFAKPDHNDDYYSSLKQSRRYKKPSYDDDDYKYKSSIKRDRESQDYSYSSSNWKSRREERKLSPERKRTPEPDERELKIVKDNSVVEKDDALVDKDQYLSDEKMNKLAAKIVKAEIMGDVDLVNKLKSKLEAARTHRKENPNAGKSKEEPEGIMLMASNSRGDYRPLTKSGPVQDPRSKGGKRKAETHTAGERMKYFSNDDGRSLSQMFEQEKYTSNYDDDEQLAKIAAKHTNPNDDLEDIFTDEISKNVNHGKEDEKNRQRSIKEHERLEKSLEGCEYCVGSKAMMKHLIVSCGNKVYLAVPSKKSLTKGHCVITTVQHATCVTAVDEEVWEEIMNFRRALVNLFNSQDQDVVFFETAVRLNKFPHLVINCVPIPRDVGDTAPIYFKKALLECEAEWSMNKKVVDLKGKNIRKGVPKGLPYFWIDFGMDAGFAHVIEDQQLFPSNFAEEIIGGILDLDHQLWKRPGREQGDQLRRKVSEFVQMWKTFDTVSKNKL